MIHILLLLLFLVISFNIGRYDFNQDKMVEENEDLFIFTWILMLIFTAISIILIFYKVFQYLLTII